MHSSYMANNFYDVICNTVFAFPASVAVELGVLDGYSTMAIAESLSQISILKQQTGHLHSYDLWEDYPYRHGDIDKVTKMLKDNDLLEFVSLYKMDAYEVHNSYEDNSVDLLHIDISNDGDALEKMMELWHPKIRHCGLILFEGGSEERDKIEWMVKYNKKPIRPVLDSLKIIQENYIYGTYDLFPSLTIMKRIT